MADWLAGVAGFDITPPLGVDLTGFGGRPGAADRVLDRLYVRAIALQAPGEAPVVLTGADLLGISDALVARIRAAAADFVPAARLLLNHSHTHAGPNTGPLRCMGRTDAAYCDLVAGWTVSAVREALRCLGPARVAFGTAATAIGVNRREQRAGQIVLGCNPAGTYDPAVSVLRVEGTTGEPLACWFSHATHPVVMGGSNSGLSAEWPGAAAAALERALGCPAVFAQGCCGDVNPVRRGDYDVVRSVGRELAGAALVAWEHAVPLETPAGPRSAGVLETVELPLQVPSVASATAALTDARLRLERAEAERGGEHAGKSDAEAVAWRDLAAGLVGWAEDYARAARAGANRTVPMQVQALRLGDLVLAATGAETFVEIGQEICRRAATPRAVALGYSNGCFGYLPTERAFPLGGYEIEGAFKYYGTLMVTSECERLTLAAAERVLAAVSPTGGD